MKIEGCSVWQLAREVLSKTEGLESYVPQRENALKDPILVKRKNLLHNTPKNSLQIDAAVFDWYNGWVEGKVLHPNFMSFMHQNYNGLALKSSIEFMLIINANPNEMQTIYTTIMRAIKDANKSPTIITFDLPLFIKTS